MIAPEEIAEAAVVVLNNEVAMPEQELVRQAARLLGYERAADQVRQAVMTGLELLYRSGRAARFGDQVRLQP
jgi:hypothetical protein